MELKNNSEICQRATFEYLMDFQGENRRLKERRQELRDRLKEMNLEGEVEKEITLKPSTSVGRRTRVMSEERT
jgi:hypothetical protein